MHSLSTSSKFIAGRGVLSFRACLLIRACPRSQNSLIGVQACLLVALEEEAAFRRHQDAVLNRFVSHSQQLARDLERSSRSLCASPCLCRFTSYTVAVLPFCCPLAGFSHEAVFEKLSVVLWTHIMVISVSMGLCPWPVLPTPNQDCPWNGLLWQIATTRGEIVVGLYLAVNTAFFLAGGARGALRLGQSRSTALPTRRCLSLRTLCTALPS
jgi:hypothetical protein